MGWGYRDVQNLTSVIEMALVSLTRALR